MRQDDPTDDSWMMTYARAYLAFLSLGVVLIAGLILVALTVGPQNAILEWGLAVGGLGAFGASIGIFGQTLRKAERKR